MPGKMPLLDAIQQAHQRGYRAIQLFLSDPDTWQTPFLLPSLALAITEALREANFSSVVVHTPFILDLSSEKEVTWVNSILLLRLTIEQARLIGASDVVVHLTNYKRPYTAVSDQSIKRIVRALTLALSQSSDRSLPPVRVLLENGCDPHASPGSTMQVLGTILHSLPLLFPSRIQVCLDTAHCWASGYDLCSHMEPFLHLVEQSIGLANVRLIHLNDAKNELGSTRDEHAQWGMGQISARGVRGIQSLLQDPRLSHVALILETPLLKHEDGHIDWEQEKQHLAVIKRLFSVCVSPP